MNTTDSVHRLRGLRATMPDGVALTADAWLPDQSGSRWPVLLQRLPYGRSVASTSVLPHPAWFARQGYAVVVQDTRGRGESEGSFRPFLDEAADGVASIEWAAQLDFSNGDVATYGFSYQGINQLYAAAEKPPHLRAIAPMMCCPDPYEGWIYEGGCLRLPFVAFWAAQLAGQDLKRGPIPFDVQALPVKDVFGPEPPVWFTEWLEHPTDDEYWAARRPNLSAIDVPVFMVMGYFDDFASGSAQIIEKLKAEAVCGPWMHMPWGSRHGDFELGPTAGPEKAWNRLLAFFDRHLKEVAGEPPPRIDYYTGGRGWTTTQSWPPKHEVMVFGGRSSGNANSRHGDGRLEPDPSGSSLPDVLVAKPFDPYPGLPAPLSSESASEDRRDVLCYTTAELDRDMIISGAAKVVATTTSDAPGHDLVASLIWVDADGESHRLSTGAQRGCDAYRISLRPVSWLVPRGSRLRLDLSASRFPHFDRNPQNNVEVAAAREEDCRVATIEVSDVILELPIEDRA